MTVRYNLEQFAQLMENRFQQYDENRGTNTWLDEPVFELVRKLDEKFQEFEGLLQSEYSPPESTSFIVSIIPEEDLDSAKLKLIDLANRAFMLFDRIK